MRDSPEFTDVTLSYKEKGQFKAHKILLANNNTFSLLVSTPHPNPLMYLKGPDFFFSICELKHVDLLGTFIMFRFR